MNDFANVQCSDSNRMYETLVRIVSLLLLIRRFTRRLCHWRCLSAANTISFAAERLLMCALAVLDSNCNIG
eukprot:scaffold349951_cov19-Prasinocladus_malaysianus.AAC.1